MRSKKLSRTERERVLAKIVKKYDDYIHRFFKSVKVRAAFEERYFNALQNDLDLDRFFAAEISAIEELIKREEDRINRDETQPPSESVKEEGFADRILKELMAKLEKYPDIKIHGDANPEIRRLLGALKELDDKIMPMLQDALKNTNYAFNTQVMMNLDSRLRSLSVSRTDDVPDRLARYLNLLNIFPRDYKVIDREEKAFILETSFFLHDLCDILTQAESEYSPITTDQMEKLKRAMQYLEGLLEDFRLKDFKRKNF